MSQLGILQHALGVDQYGQGEQYRNHFCTGPGSNDYDACMALVEQGLMMRRDGSPLTGGDYLFRVTDWGKAFVALSSPKPPKLTPGQQRYREYLIADSCLTFGEWIKRSRTAVITRPPYCRGAEEI